MKFAGNIQFNCVQTHQVVEKGYGKNRYDHVEVLDQTSDLLNNVQTKWLMIKNDDDNQFEMILEMRKDSFCSFFSIELPRRTRTSTKSHWKRTRPESICNFSKK